VFPAGQGTGKYFVVASSASSTTVGQLRYWLIDMSLNGGLGGVVAPTAGTALGTAVASTAVTSVPNADGTGYWVLSPNKRGNAVLAYKFDANGPTNASSPVSSAVGTAVITSPSGAINTAYEDIRFNPTLTRVATMASNNTTSSGTNNVRLLTFNAATGALSLVREQTVTQASNNYGYNVEFSPNGNYLFASRIRIGSNTGTTAQQAAIFRATLTSSSWSFSSLVTAPNSPRNGGMIRLGPNQRLYWAQNGGTAANGLRQATFNTDNSTLTWSNQPLSTNAAFGLSQTLADCAIAPASFNIEKLDSVGAAVAGSQFALYPNVNGSAGGTAVSPGVTAGTGVGKFEVKGIAPGTYWLRETKAPEGHSLLAQDVLIEVKLRGEVLLDGAPNPQVKLVVAGGVYTLKVSDNAALTLPLTGGQWIGVLTVGGIAVLVAALIGTWWWRRRQRPAANGPPDTGGEAP
jgi:LPXTG-motif cell wall-anchored protein